MLVPDDLNCWIAILLGLELMILAYVYYRVLISQIPSSQCEALDETLRDTQSFLESVVDQGLICKGQIVADTQQALAR